MSGLNLLEELFDGRVPRGLGGRWYGVYPAVVSDNNDPEGQGRVRVTLPWAPDTGGDRYEAWARVATLMGGHNRGSWFIPDVGDEVLVLFEGGDPRRPYVVGGLWNGRDDPPASMDSRNSRKVLRSRNGVQITLDDTDGQEKLILETPGGQRLTMKDGPGAVEIVDSNGNSIKLQTGGVTVTSSAKV
ncbi:MAG TPA: phage baseplate assembly protein V, partial [Pyrinomonadaceae bacterium]|nr:phage baseplate assembly protein V [Pyrinomonadaceae bacterium]